MKMFKKFALAALILSLSTGLFAMDEGLEAFMEGADSYNKGDWVSSVFQLKKAAAYEINDNPDTYYLLISAMMNCERYSEALGECENFLERFSSSVYDPHVSYLKGRALFALGEYEKSVIILSDYCHQYEGHEMYASALFWIGESFYACCQYDDALSLYERIVTEFPGDGKASAAQYRIETVNQRNREEKLLYLLKQTGEEYLFAKEEYEKQLRIYGPDNDITRQRLSEMQQRYRELEDKNRELERQIAEIQKTELETGKVDNSDVIRSLKDKAAEVNLLLQLQKQ